MIKYDKLIIGGSMNINVSDMFLTSGINIVAFVYAVLIFVLFVVKGKSHKISSKIFFALILVTIIVSCLNNVTAILASKNSDYTHLLAVFSLFGVGVWNTLLIYYVSVIFKTNEENVEFFSKHPYINYIIGFVVVLVLSLVCIFLKIDFTQAGEGLPYLYSGSLLNFADIYGGIAIVYAVVCITINRKKLDKNSLVLCIFTIISCSSLLLLNVLKIMQLNHTSFLQCLVLFFLYLSLESQDALLIDEYKESVKISNDYNKLRSEFIINMSHQLRTPLTSVLGFSDYLIHNDFNHEELKEDSKNIYLASKDLLDLINSIIDVSKFETNKEAVLINNYSLDTVIYDISSIINAYNKKENLVFSINANDDCPNDLVGDDRKINKILNILLKIAIDHTDYGEVSLNVSNNMIDSSNSELVFHIKNTGHALTVSDFDKTFDDLIKLSNEFESSIDAKSLSLIVAKSLIEIIGGNIEFINEEGKGTQYIIKIKQKVVSQNKLGNIRDKIETKSSISHHILNLSNKRVLIVDTDKINISILDRMLKQYSVICDISNDLNDGMNLFNTHTYDIIFVADSMDNFSGNDFIQKLNSTGNRIPPVIGVVTKKSSDVSQYFDIVDSPIEFRELNAIMNRLFMKGENENEF